MALTTPFADLKNERLAAEVRRGDFFYLMLLHQSHHAEQINAPVRKTEDTAATFIDEASALVAEAADLARQRDNANADRRHSEHGRRRDKMIYGILAATFTIFNIVGRIESPQTAGCHTAPGISAEHDKARDQ